MRDKPLRSRGSRKHSADQASNGQEPVAVSGCLVPGMLPMASGPPRNRFGGPTGISGTTLVEEPKRSLGNTEAADRLATVVTEAADCRPELAYILAYAELLRDNVLVSSCCCGSKHSPGVFPPDRAALVEVLGMECLESGHRNVLAGLAT